MYAWTEVGGGGRSDGGRSVPVLVVYTVAVAERLMEVKGKVDGSGFTGQICIKSKWSSSLGLNIVSSFGTTCTIRSVDISESSVTNM